MLTVVDWLWGLTILNLCALVIFSHAVCLRAYFDDIACFLLSSFIFHLSSFLLGFNEISELSILIVIISLSGCIWNNHDDSVSEYY